VALPRSFLDPRARRHSRGGEATELRKTKGARDPDRTAHVRRGMGRSNDSKTRPGRAEGTSGVTKSPRNQWRILDNAIKGLGADHRITMEETWLTATGREENQVRLRNLVSKAFSASGRAIRPRHRAARSNG